MCVNHSVEQHSDPKYKDRLYIHTEYKISLYFETEWYWWDTYSKPWLTHTVYETTGLLAGTADQWLVELIWLAET